MRVLLLRTGPCALTMVVALSFFPSGCRKGATSTQSASTPPPKSPQCILADDKRAAARAQLSVGRLRDALLTLDAADEACSISAAESDIDRVTALAELGRKREVDAVAARIESSGDARAKQAATDAKKRVDAVGKESLDALAEAAGDEHVDEAERRRRIERARDRLEAASGARPTIFVQGPVATVMRVAWDRDGVLVAHGPHVSWYRGVPSREHVRWTCGPGEPIESLSVSDGRVLAATHRAVCTFDRTTLAERHTELAHAPAALTSGKGALVAISASDPRRATATVMRVDSFEELRKIRARKGPVVAMDVSRDGSKVALGDEVFDVETGLLRARLSPRPYGDQAATISSVRFDKSGHNLAIASSIVGNALELFPLERNAATWLAELRRPAPEITFSPEGGLLASAGTLTVRIWSAATGKGINQEGSLKEHTDGITSVAWSPDGDHLVSGGRDETFRLWDPKTGKSTETIRRAAAVPRNMSVSADGKHLLLTYFDGVRSVALDGSHDEGELVGDVLGTPVSVDAMRAGSGLLLVNSRGIERQDDHGKVVWSREGWSDGVGVDEVRRVALIRREDAVEELSLDDGASRGKVITGPIVTLSREGRLVSRRDLPGDTHFDASDAGSYRWSTGPLRIYDIAARKVVTYLEADAKDDWSVSFLPDGDVIGAPMGSYAPDASVDLWQLQRFDGATGKAKWKAKLARATRRVVASPDGKLVMVAHAEDLELFDARTGVLLRTIESFADDAVFSPDGQRLVVRERARVSVYRVTDGVRLQTYLRASESHGLVVLDAQGRPSSVQGQRARLLCAIGPRVVPMSICDDTLTPEPAAAVASASASRP